MQAQLEELVREGARQRALIQQLTELGSPVNASALFKDGKSLDVTVGNERESAPSSNALPAGDPLLQRALQCVGISLCLVRR